MITAAEFDRLADLPVNDPAGDMTPYLDLSKARRPGREVQRVNVDFPVDLLRAIDREGPAHRRHASGLHQIAESDTLVNPSNEPRFGFIMTDKTCTELPMGERGACPCARQLAAGTVAPS
jgi:hypothetical protein